MTQSFFPEPHKAQGDQSDGKGINSCIPGRKPRHLSRLEAMFEWRRGWQRITTRYDRCLPVFFMGGPKLNMRPVFLT